MELGPTNTLFPILISLERWHLSWMTQLSPMLIFLVPMIVAPYQMDELMPTVTLPRTVALGATKSVPSKSGLAPECVKLRKLGTNLSSEAFSPSSLVPAR
mgnify:CR=1 FL=1